MGDAQDALLLINLSPGDIEQSKLLISIISHDRTCYHQ